MKSTGRASCRESGAIQGRASGIGRRTALLVLTGLGAVVALLAGGVVAPFTDVAFTGVNRAESAARDLPANLQLAPFEGGCGEFADDLTSALVLVADLQPGQRASGDFCLRNAGPSPLQVTFRRVDLAGAETGCTGAEPQVDQSCGDGIGELGTVLLLERSDLDCSAGSALGLIGDEFHASFQEMPIRSDSSPSRLSPGQVVCLRYGVYFRDVADGVTEEAIQAAQSDSLEWRFRFTGTTG